MWDDVKFWKRCFYQIVEQRDKAREELSKRKVEFPANPKHGDTFRWFDNDGWYKRIGENGLWEQIKPNAKPKFEEFRTHFYWLGSAAEVMYGEPRTSLEETEMYGPSPALRKAMMGLKYGEPKLPRGVRTEPYYDDFYHRDLLYKWRKSMNLGRPVYWTE